VNELERALTALGRALAVPEAPDLLPAVLAGIEPTPAQRPQPRRWVLAVAVVVLAVLAATLAIPDARSALFRVLHIGGERIEFVDDLPAVSPAPTGLDLDVVLGRSVTLEEARRRAGFDLRELDEAAPDRVYLGERGTVWFLFGTPERVRLLVAQTPLLFVDETLFLKKLAGPGTQIEQVAVDGSTGFFLVGEPHLLLLLDANGQVVEESARLAKNVLVWESGGVAYRLEGDFGKDNALRLADSLR
jgi:hypothetical protein